MVLFKIYFDTEFEYLMMVADRPALGNICSMRLIVNFMIVPTLYSDWWQCARLDFNTYSSQRPSGRWPRWPNSTWDDNIKLIDFWYPTMTSQYFLTGDVTSGECSDMMTMGSWGAGGGQPRPGVLYLIMSGLRKENLIMYAHNKRPAANTG